MELVKFKAIPNYEYSRNGVYALFDGEGNHVTKDAKVIKELGKAEPFIKKIDEKKPEKEAPVKPKTKAK